MAGGHGSGNASNQLCGPYGIYVDFDQTVYVADTGNHRIVEWKAGVTDGRIVAGGNGKGSGINQLNEPCDVIIDQQSESLIISDRGNDRVLQWFRGKPTSEKVLIESTFCRGLRMDNNGLLYTVDISVVRQYRVGMMPGIVVAGDNEMGALNNQLNSPIFLFIDEDSSIYVSDYNNHRVMKWMRGAKEGIVVAGGHGQGDGLNQFSYPQGVVVDSLGTVYVVDYYNYRIMRWRKGAKQGEAIVHSKELCAPRGLSMDRHGNLYVVDWGNNRVQQYLIQN